MKTWIVAGALTAGFLAACQSAASAGALSPEAEARLAEFRKTGETRDCLPSSSISQILPLSDSLFLVRVGAGQFWLNETRGRCRNAASNFTRLQYRTTGQLCRNEIINVVDSGAAGGFLSSCGLGTFERLERSTGEDDPAS
jgi:hypothetical protein